MQIKNNPDELLHQAQGPLATAHAMVKYSSDSEGGRIARYFAHHDLMVMLSKAAGYRKAERPLKLYLKMLEMRGIQKPSPAQLRHMQEATYSPADELDRLAIQMIQGLPLYPTNEDERSKGLQAIATIRRYTDEHWVMPSGDERDLLDRLAALQLAYMPEAGRA